MKKYKFLVIALLSYSVIALGGCAKQEIKNIDSKGKNIICFGDSITFGYGVGLGQDYPSVLSKMLGRQVINAGEDSDTTVDALKRLKTDVLNKEPLLVIVELSGNDFIQKIPLEDSLANINKIVDSIQSKGAMVAIVDISAGLFLRKYRLELGKIAREKKAIFIPAILRRIITNPNMKSDFLHPNEEGYKLIAQRIYQVIEPYLKQNSLNSTLRK